MRCTVASAGNDHRLGAQEAPPAIISLYPGQGFESFVDSVVSGGDLLGPGLKISEKTAKFSATTSACQELRVVCLCAWLPSACKICLAQQDKLSCFRCTDWKVLN